MMGRKVYLDPRTGELLLRGGDYGQAHDGMWHMKPPGSNAIVVYPGHVEELPGGTISVNFTIAASDGAGHTWTGHLVAGEWIQR